MKYDRDIWNSQKYLIELTIPEMSISTDCILSRLTIINVEQTDLSFYYINATSPGFSSEYGRIHLYRRKNFIIYLETSDCQQFITHRNKKGCKRICTQISSTNKIFSRFDTFFLSCFYLFDYFKHSIC
ncbi:unnamed protein product [Rotaria sp. Silwood2]|nr:unnamed protein product [Rotaria sp. Silwood2]CAF2821761.1 unnamed protein product [Rotaria sp. Silwood2]CAF3373083.1 unnamed protein product [Rotaria sp. Silwood2]CAF3468596.1 unnamed protein product [Rotaria sp. Silwood2]CAF4076457.1 unnamed protein product [Rotaria sp. Silwood2]